jgi:3-oxoacyl-[acyl-carrier-protein] synthase-1
MVRRVVVTGMGIVSSIGNNTQEVLASLREARSGIVKSEDYARLGFRCQVHGAPNLDLDQAVDRRVRRFMGDGAAWNWVAMQQAITDSGLEEKETKSERTGIIMGSGGPSTKTIVGAADTTRQKGPKRVGPFAVPAAMSSTNSATLAVPFGIRGVNYSISSACATSAHCIGNSMELIQWGKQDVMFAGGGEELDWTLSVLFDAMGAMSSKFNQEPTKASRPYDKNRDGFVIAGGAGVLVLEELGHAKARGAKIYAELVGYGATSDGVDMVQPSGVVDSQGKGRLHQSSCHLYADWRQAGNRGHPRCFRREHSQDIRHQVSYRALARCHRRSGGNLFHSNDEERFYLRKCQYRAA